ncbi:arylsulfatase B-like [Saccoglossus kowalevskii]
MKEAAESRDTENIFSRYRLVTAFLFAVAAIMFITLYDKKTNPPHIVLILADDLGWNDIGWNNLQIKTPVLDKLAYEGVIFNQTYVQPLCTPTRAALMTGYYPFRIGMQHQMVLPFQPSGLPLHLKILPQKLKQAGYINHIVGKWHLGYCNWEYTPLNRGFDSFYGSFSNSVNHNNKISQLPISDHSKYKGYDFRDNTGVVQNDGQPLTKLFTQRVVDIISNHHKDYPMFMYFPINQPSKGSEVYEKYTALYPNVTDDQVRQWYATLSLMDDAVGHVIDALKSRGMWEETLLIFISDNGAFDFMEGTNLPLRGAGTTLFEGGMRVPAIAHGKMIKKTGYINNELNHITDWHSTILSLAGIQPEPDLDGINIWGTVSEGKASARNEIVYNIDEIDECRGAALRLGDWKVITGNPGLMCRFLDLNKQDGWLQSGRHSDNQAITDFQSISNVSYLFNLKEDPEERHNVAEKYPEVFSALLDRLNEYRKNVVPAIDTSLVKEGNPENYGGVLTPGWC